MKFHYKLFVFNNAFLAVFLQLVAFSYQTEITHISKNEIRPLGGDVRFDCTIVNPDNYTILWTKINKNRSEQFPLATNTQMLIHNKRFSVNKETLNYTLKINNLEESDIGFYQCQISVDVNKNIFEEVSLQLEVPPKITNVSPGDASVVEGASANLQCLAEGYPTPQIMWKREKNEIFSFGGTLYSSQVLNLTKVSRMDRGIYHCIANNGVEPAAQASVKVDIQFAPVVHTVRPRVGQARGHSVKLQCHVEANPLPTITWLKGNIVIITEKPHSSTNEFIHVHHINLIGPEDYGFYTCRAENNLGKAETIIELYKTDIPWNFTD